jgi:hypothetical protein
MRVGPLLLAMIFRLTWWWLVNDFFGFPRGFVDVFIAEQSEINNGSLPINYSLPGISRGEIGWMRGWALEYIFYLCGEDCVVRFHGGISDLADIENQAEENLRRSFAVVGLLNETDIFFDMIDARVQYLNTSRDEALTTII